MSRTRKGNRGIRIKNVSYSFDLLMPKNNFTIYQCRKHYNTLINKDGFFSVEFKNGIYLFFEVKF